MTNVFAILLLKKIFPCFIAAKRYGKTIHTDTHYSGELAKLKFNPLVFSRAFHRLYLSKLHLGNEKFLDGGIFLEDWEGYPSKSLWL